MFGYFLENSDNFSIWSHLKWCMSSLTHCSYFHNQCSESLHTYATENYLNMLYFMFSQAPPWNIYIFLDYFRNKTMKLSAIFQREKTVFKDHDMFYFITHKQFYAFFNKNVLNQYMCRESVCIIYSCRYWIIYIEYLHIFNQYLHMVITSERSERSSY